MLDHSYQFSTRQYEMLRTNEDNGMIENKSVPAGEESTKNEACREQTRIQKKTDEAKE